MVAQGSGTLRAKLGSWLFWLSQALSIAGLSTILEDLRVWGQIIAWILSYVQIVAPWLAEFLRNIGYLAHIVAVSWRFIFHPIIDIFLFWFPWEIPLPIKDAILVVVFIAFGRFRAEKFWFGAYGWQMKLIHEIAIKHGVDLSKGKNEYVYSVRQYAEWRKRNDFGSRSGYNKLLEQSLQEDMGKKYFEFVADLIENTEFMNMEEWVKFVRIYESYMKAIVWCLGCFVLFILALDFALYGPPPEA